MTTTVERILVPVDLSPFSDVALSYAAAMAERFHSGIDVLHVSEPLFAGRPSSALELRLRFERSESGRRMRACIERFEERGVLLRGLLHVSHDEATAIVEVAADGRYDLIAMGANGRGRPRYLGRVAAAVLERADCPVVLLHGPERPQRLARHRIRPIDLSVWLPAEDSASHLTLISRDARPRCPTS